MTQFAPGTKVYISCKPIDLRKGFDGLTAEVSNVIRMNPFSGHLFVFRGKRGDYVKILYWDGSGLCLFAKRLEQGRFVWPPIIDERFHITQGQLSALLEGMDWRRAVATPESHRPAFV
jgi:transposase